MRKILSIFIIALLLVGCTDTKQTKEPQEAETSDCTIEQIEYPFGEWKLQETGNYCHWDVFLNDTYQVFEGKRERNTDVYQYVVYTYDCTGGTWEKNDFKWNKQLNENHINMMGNYQVGSNGNVYFLGCKMITDNGKSGEWLVRKIYCITPDGQLTELNKEEKLMEEIGEINSFRLLENGKLLVYSVQDGTGVVKCIDFAGAQVTDVTSLGDRIDSSIALNTLVVEEDELSYPYQLDEGTYAIRFQKLEKSIPEKVVLIEGDFSEGMGPMYWNVGRSGDGGVYMFTSQGIWKCKEDTAEPVVGEKELSVIFNEYVDVISTAQVNENEYYAVVQNDKKLALFRVQI